jgi:hypothetical protein
VIDDDSYRTRRVLTFAQAEGTEALPSQLKRTEISSQLASSIWAVLHEEIQTCNVTNYFGDNIVVNAWENILSDYHVRRLYLPIDEFDNLIEGSSGVLGRVKKIIYSGSYVEFYDFLQFVLRHKNCSSEFAADISYCLESAHAGYRLVNGDTFIPLTTEEEARAVESAFNDVLNAEIGGANRHLRNAADCLTKGNYTDCIRESIHAVESVARTLAPSRSLSESLAVLEESIAIHGALKAGFNSIYGYTSDEQGIRHPLLEKESASVDETDAIFMFGACASFMSYLIGKARSANLLKTKKNHEAPSP